MRKRVYEWTEGANPKLVSVRRCDNCQGEMPPDGGYMRGEFRYCGKYCLRAHAAQEKARQNVLTNAGTVPHHVVGIDLSLNATALVAIPTNWDHNLANVKTTITGSKLPKDASPLDRAHRNAQIAHDVVVFCINMHATQIAIEDYAYGAGQANAIRTAECGGVVKHEVAMAIGAAIVPINISSARKVLLQRVPAKKTLKAMGHKGTTKEWVTANVKRLGPIAEAWTHDQCDAFAIANCALEVFGMGTPLSFPGE